MFISTKRLVYSSFAFVDKYIVHDDRGDIHLGRTIRKYLDDNYIKYKGVSESIGMSRGGFSRMLESKSISIERINQVSKFLGHDFFKYLLRPETKDEIMKASEPSPDYKPEKKKKPIKVTLTFDDGDPDMDSPLIKKLNEIIRQLNEESGEA